jgi:hypothetical protein
MTKKNVQDKSIPVSDLLDQIEENAIKLGKKMDKVLIAKRKKGR